MQQLIAQQPIERPHRQAMHWNNQVASGTPIQPVQHQLPYSPQSVPPGYSYNTPYPASVSYPVSEQGQVPQGYRPMSQFVPLAPSNAPFSAPSDPLPTAPPSFQSAPASHLNPLSQAAPLPSPARFAHPEYPSAIGQPVAMRQAVANPLPPGAAPGAVGIPAATENRSYKLKCVGVAAFEKRLLDTFANYFIPLETTPGVAKNPNVGEYRLPARDGSRLELAIDRRNGIIGLTGTPATLDASVRLLKLLDTAEESDERRTELMPFAHKNYRAVVQTVDVIEQETAGDSATAPSGPAQALAPGRPGPEPSRPESSDRNVMQWGAAGTPNGRGAASNPLAGINPEAGAAPVDVQGAGIVGTVRIQIIDELGTIVITGERRDVAIVRGMIEQLENVSMEHEPEISLFRMRQTDALRVTQIVLQLYNQIYSSRRGMVSLTAMTKPNAILLVGQKESIELAVELIRKLDIPVAPESQFIVIRLRNASSDNLQSYLTTFYEENGTLSTRVRIVSDFRTNSLIVQGSPRDMNEVAALVKQLDTPGSDAVNVMRIFPLKNALASSLATVIQNAITGTTSTTVSGGFGGIGGGGAGGSATMRVGSRNAMIEMATVDPEAGTAVSGIPLDVRVVADASSNSLVVNAPADTMPLIETLIMQLDRQPSAQSQVKLFMINNGDAYALAEMLRQLFGVTTTGTGGGFGQTGAGGTNTYATTRMGTDPEDSTLVGVRFAVDTRTNSIVATGSASDMTLVEALLIRLDDENMHNREVITFKLLNTPVGTVATALTNYIAQERQIENQAIGTFNPQGAKEQYLKETVVIPETVTNTLIISAAPKYREQIIKLVQELDERPPMVCIQVLIAEVTLTNGCEFGTELGIQDSILFDRSVGGVPGFLFNNGDALGNNTETANPQWIGSQGISSLGVGRKSSTNDPGGFVFSASSESVSILIRALETMNKLQIISRPMLTTLDNKEANIQVGETFAYVDNTNMDNGVVSNSIDWLDTGIVLQVTPGITPDDQVVMQLYVERSKTGPENEGTIIGSQGDQVWRVPRIEITKASSCVSAMSAQTIIIGGLIHEETHRTEVGIPFLNKIPVLKHAFNFETQNKTRKELIIVMTPVVVRDEYDMEMLRQQETGRMNWCMADVVKLGGGKMRSRCSDWYAGETEMVPMKGATAPDEHLLPSEDHVRRNTPHAAIPPAPTLEKE